MLQTFLNQSPSKIFIQTVAESYTYGTVHEKVKKITGLFKSLNVGIGNRIIVSSRNEIEVISIFLAALAREIGVIMLDPETKSPRFEAIIDKVEPTLVIVDEDLIDEFKLSKKESIKCLYIKSGPIGSNRTDIINYEKALLVSKSESLKDSPNNASLAYIMFTSGTTSEPKGVAISQKNLFLHLKTLHKTYELTDESQILNPLMLSHADGLIQGPILAAFTGCTLHRPFDFAISGTKALLEYINSNSITHFIAVPTILHFIEQHSKGYEGIFKKEYFRYVISVSANLPRRLWDSFEIIFKTNLANVYGLTETVAGSLFCVPASGSYKKFTVGKPVDCLVRIIDDKGNEVQENTVGELCLMGPHIMKGYWKNDSSTNDTIKNGWLRTGDLASKDDEGFISITGRKKNTIISGGLNIQPEEITECILYNQNVSEAFAFGLPDDVFGDKLVVAVVGKQRSTLTEAGIIDFCASRLEKKLLPQKIYFFEKLPKGISGKVQIEKLKELCLRDDENSTKNGELEIEFKKLVSDIFHVEVGELDIAETDFFQLGGDSLLAAFFLAKIEQAFKVNLQFKDIFRNPNLKAICNAIGELQAAKAISRPAIEGDVTPEINRLDNGDKNHKMVILANDYYEVNQIYEHVKYKYECYFVKYPILEKYSYHRERGLDKFPSIEEIAAEINELLLKRKIISDDTILMGFSFGGLIAYQMSSYLLQSKHIKQHKVILLDAVVSDFRYPVWIQYRVKIKRRLDTIQLNAKNKFNLVSARFSKNSNTKEVALKNNRSFVSSHKAYKASYFDLAKKIINGYQPNASASGNVILITSEKNEAKNENNNYWKTKIKTGLTIINVPGNHMTFLKEPQLSKWLAQLDKVLKEQCDTN